MCPNQLQVKMAINVIDGNRYRFAAQDGNSRGNCGKQLCGFFTSCPIPIGM